MFAFCYRGLARHLSRLSRQQRWPCVSNTAIPTNPAVKVPPSLADKTPSGQYCRFIAFFGRRPAHISREL
jgi:hypothetical protein